ncbi:MAG: hypothetical protein K2Q28_13945 [Hyphomicrobium sp.]|nr:hypothetical protein [Hyphomicrobium sp.]
MTGQIPISAVMTLIGGTLLVLLMWYASTGPVMPDMVISCEAGEGGRIRQFPVSDCTFVGKTLADDVQRAPVSERTSAPAGATAVPLGGIAGPEIPLRPLPEKIVERVPSLANYSYFIEGDDVALVEPDSKRVTVKIDIKQSGTP